MLLTVIIPAFNCEKTIARSIKSTGVYSNNEIEVIAINNGSTDSTEKIIKKIAKENKNVKYAESISGVSNARNKGIELSTGKWITFLDADDYITDTRKFDLKKYSSPSFASTDLIFFNYFVGHSKVNLYSMTETKNDVKQLLTTVLENPTKYLTVWGKLYRTNTIKKNGIHFDTSLSYSEDSEFLIRYLLFCKHVTFEDSFLYNYCLSEDSTVRKYNPSMINEYQKAIQKIRKDTLPYPYLKRSYLIFVLMQFNLMMVHNVFIEPSNQLQQLKAMCKKEYMAEALTAINLGDIFTPRLTPLVLCKYHFYFLASLIYKFRVFQNTKKQ